MNFKSFISSETKSQICNYIMDAFRFIWEVLLWAFFKVLLPGFPFFLAMFINRYLKFIELDKNISIVIESDILLLGASLASGIAENSVQNEYKLGSFGRVVSLVSLLFFLGIFFILYVPQIAYEFRGLSLKSEFWRIMWIGCILNIATGIVGDIILEKKWKRDEKAV